MWKLNRVPARRLHTFTTINPQSVKLHYPETFHKSLILLSTSSQIGAVTNKIIELKNNSNSKAVSTSSVPENIVVACIDSVNGSRNGYSELWFNSKVTLKNFETIEQMNKRLTKKENPLSVDPIKMDRLWKDNRLNTSLNINFTNSKFGLNDVLFNLSNTLFSNGEPSTCFTIGLNEEYDWYNLSNLSLEIDNSQNEIFSAESAGNKPKIQYFNRLKEIPMVVEDSDKNEVYEVTDFEGNLIKSINDKSASGYLTDNSIVMESKKELYFQVGDDKSQDDKWMQEYYKLIVGGLGWGEKQAFVAIDPDVGEVGYRQIKLFYYDECNTRELQITDTGGQSRIVLESSNVQDSYGAYGGDSADSTAPAVEVPNVFSCGGELGFRCNGVWHKSPGEALVV